MKNPYDNRNGIWVDMRFWECECETYPLHAYAVDTDCPLCGVDTKNPAHKARWMPAMCDMIALGGKFAESESWLIAYNQSPYYDLLDLFDCNRGRREWARNRRSVTSWERAELYRKIRDEVDSIAIKAQVATVDDTTTPKG